MAQRYQSGIIAVSQAATTVVHNLSGGTPIEYGAAPFSITATYFAGVSQTNVTIAAGLGGASANVFCSIPYTMIQ